MSGRGAATPGRRATGAGRGRALRIAGSATVAVVAAAGVALAIGFGSSGSGTKRGPISGRTQPFGQHYAGLERRRDQLGVPTMMQTMNSSIHYHPQLAVFANGRRITVPANIGIDPNRDPMDMAGLHTHDTTGTIHVEGADQATLGKFFGIWGVALSPRRLGPYTASGKRMVRMWVDGKPSSALGALKLADNQRIVVSIGTDTHPPAGL